MDFTDGIVHVIEDVMYKSKLFNSVLNIGQDSGQADKNQYENLIFSAHRRIAKLYDK